MSLNVTRTSWAMAQQIRVSGTVPVPAGSYEIVTVISGGPASTTKVTSVTGPTTASVDVEHFAIRQAGVIDANVAVIVRDATTKAPASVFTDAATVGARPAIGSAPVGAGIRPDLYTSSLILSLLPALQCTRVPIAWSTAQPSSSAWDATQLALYDACFADLGTRGIKAQVTCGTTPAWARTGGTTLSPATNPADHAAFIDSIVDRWGSHILCVDPWNEPDLSYSGSPAQYVALLAAVRAAVDPAMPVCLGPFSLANITYLESLFSAGLTGSMFTWLDLHPYPFSHGSGADRWIEPTSMPAAAEADGGVIPGIHKMEASLAGHGITNVPLIISEIGIATDPVDTSEPQMRMSQQDAAAWLDRSLDLVRRLPSLRAVNIHQGRDITTAPGWTESFGLLDQNNNRRAAWSTVAAIVGTPAFNPLTELPPLHGVWADDPAWANPGNNNLISFWRNQSGGGDPAQISSTNQPRFLASVSQLNSRAAAQFAPDAGNEDFLSVDIADIAQAFKVLVVFRLTATPAAQAGIVGFGGGATHGFSFFTTPSWRLSTGSNLSGGIPDTNGHVARMTVNGASSQLWIDGASVATGNAGTNALTRWKLGCLGSGATSASFAPVAIAFCGIYAASTSDAEVAVLEAQLRSYYATP